MPQTAKTIINNKTVLITGGTGSFGKAFTSEILTNYSPKAVRIYSRDEFKQWEMAQKFKSHPKFARLRFFIGDVRDKDRLERAMEDVDIVIHAAALKQVPTAEYNPMEFIKTNIIGSQNVIDTALNRGVKKVVALSTDKAAAPINLYGATKLCADKLFVAANNIRGDHKIIFSVVRYGNVMGSRGSVIPLFLEKSKTGTIPVTHSDMTRFNILLPEAVNLVLTALKNAWGGEIFVPKIPSYKLTDLAEAVGPNCKIEVIGIRPGEKLHEEMITESDSQNTLEFKDYYVILPTTEPYTPSWNSEKMVKKLKAKKVKPGFHYTSGNNQSWLNINDLRKLIKKHIEPNFSI